MTRATRTYLLAALALCGTIAGGVCQLLGASGTGDVVWQLTLVATLIPLTISVIRALLRGDVGVDVIALLAMSGALIGGELLAGAVVSVMLAGGNALEMIAAGRARRELTRLLRAAPRSARRRTPEGWSEVPVDEVEVSDTVLVRAGEVIPTDGSLLDERAIIDTSTMTGESLPIVSSALPPDFDYTTVPGISFEVRHILAAQRPETIGQASRISGCTSSVTSLAVPPSDRFAACCSGTVSPGSGTRVRSRSRLSVSGTIRVRASRGRCPAADRCWLRR